LIVKVRSHTVYQQKDGKYKCEVWYINENGETKRVTRTDPSKTAINQFAKDYPNEEYYPVCTLNEFFKEVYKKILKDTAKNTNYLKLVSIYNSQIRPVFGDRRMKSLKKAELISLLEDMAEKRCQGVVDDCYRLLERMFACYSEHKKPTDNPMRFIDCPESKIEKKVKRGYTMEELERIFGSFSVDIKTFDDQNVSSTAAVITAEQIQITKKCNDLIDLIVSGISK